MAWFMASNNQLLAQGTIIFKREYATRKNDIEIDFLIRIL